MVLGSATATLPGRAISKAGPGRSNPSDCGLNGRANLMDPVGPGRALLLLLGSISPVFRVWLHSCLLLVLSLILTQAV